MADKGGYIGRNPGDSSTIIARQQFLPTGIQTDFTFNSGYTPGFMDVFLNGVKLVDVRDYAATTGNTVGLTSHANNGDIVELIAYKAFNLGNVTNATNNFSVGGNLTVSGDVDVDGHTELDDINVSGASTIANLVSTVSSGIVTISNTTDSTSTTTGALLVSGGVGIALSMTVGGDVSIGGTLTYEDVTNIDSIGIITARSTIDAQGDVSIADKIVHTGDTNTAIRFPSADTITAETGGSERIRINSAGHVLLNTTTDYADANSDDLQIYGTGHTGMSITSGTSHYGSIYFGDSTSANSDRNRGIVRYGHTDDAMQFWTAATERMRIDSNGYLYMAGGGGLDTDRLPNGHTINIAGTSSADGLSVIRYSASYGAYGLNIGKSNTNTLGTNTLVTDGEDLGHITFYGADGTDFNQAAAITAAVDGTPSDGTDMPGCLKFLTSPDGSATPSERVRIDSGGNFGIGSNNPQVLLHIASATPTLRIQDTTNNFYSHISVDDSGSLTLDGDAGNGAGSSRIVFKTDGSEHARIDSSGRLLVGYTASTGKDSTIQSVSTGANAIEAVRFNNNAYGPSIHLTKSRSSTSGTNTIVQDDDDLGVINFRGGDGSGWILGAEIRGAVDGTPGTNDMPGRLEFLTTADGASSTTERMRIDSSGRLLLGTTTEGAGTYGDLLTLSATHAGITIRSATTGYGSIYFSDGTSGNDEKRGLIDYYHSDNRMTFYTDASERIRIDSSGKVGINETSPDQLLHIKDSNPWIELEGTAASSGDTGIYLNANANHWIIKADNYTSGNQFQIKQGDTSSASNRLALDSNGNLALNVAFKSWHANNKAVIQGNSGYAILGRSDNQLIIAQNYYYDSSDAGKYVANGEASLYSQKDGDHLFYAAASGSADASASQVLRAVINSDGLAISSSNTAATSGYALRAEATHASGGNVAQFFNNDGSDNYGGLIINAGTTNKECRLITAYGDSFMTFYTETSGGSQEEAFRITSSQQVLFGTDNTTYGETFAFKNIREDDGMLIHQNSSNDYSGIICRHGRGLSGYNGRMFNFKRADGTTVGSIDIGPSSTGYNTTSDRRLKENETVITDSIVKLKQLKPYEFTFKDDPGPVHQGFFADEVQDVIPNGVVTGDRNAVYTEENATEPEQVGDIKAQSLDYGKLTPLLTAALQEAISKIETLETEVASLKSQINN